MLTIIQAVVQHLLSSDNLDFCKVENHLRGLFISSFFESGLGAEYLCLVEHEDLYSRLDPHLKRKVRDTAIAPKKSPDLVEAVGEFKFFPADAHINYRHPIGARLSDLHYLQDFAAVHDVTTFFLDISLQSGLVGEECYNSLWEMSREIAELIFTKNMPIENLVKAKGFKTYFRFAVDRTSRAQYRKYYGKYLFPCIDVDPGGRHLRGPVLVREPDAKTGFISIGVRRPKTKKVVKPEQTTPYLSLPKGNGAVCFAAFSPGGKMELTTADVI